MSHKVHFGGGKCTRSVYSSESASPSVSLKLPGSVAATSVPTRNLITGSRVACDAQCLGGGGGLRCRQGLSKAEINISFCAPEQAHP
jgi:hypothetical protein